MLDCAIAGGVVIDGSGRPGLRADVGIRGGRVVAIGALEERARRVIDADGRVVAPGFVDVHTHYDAQVMWDPTASPSSLHGVTTVIGGNCGFTVAPVNHRSADYVMRMLSRVEGMPVEVLEAVLDFDWQTFGEWLDRLEGRLAVNAGFLVGHSTVRRLVMGDAWQEEPSAEQLTAMTQVVDESVRGGALGLSSSWGQAHVDHLGNLVPSRYAAAPELIALASVLRGHPGTMLEFVGPSVWSDDVVATMIQMAVEAQRPLNWNLLSVGVGMDRATADARLAVSDRAAAVGAEIVALCIPVPMQLRFSLMDTTIFHRIPAWSEVLTRPPEDRERALRDPAVRMRMVTAVEEYAPLRGSSLVDFARMTVQSVSAPALKSDEGRLVGDIARDRRCSALDALLDIAVADRLRAYFTTAPAGDDEESWRLRARYWDDPRVLVGGSDAGAHLDELSTFAFFTDLVGPTVRDRGLLTLEEAVHKVTDAPARLYGLRDRGRLAAGSCADLVVFDPETVRTGDVELRGDMPGGARRLFADAVGIDHVFVNGTEIVDHGVPTGATPGTILRPGRHTGPRTF